MENNDDESSTYLMQACAICGIAHDCITEPHVFTYLEDSNYEELRDPISLEPFWDPVTLNSNCKHVFSRESIVTAINLRGCCPIDKSRQELANIETAPLVVNNLLNKLKVFCPFQCSQSTMERVQLSAHLISCPQSKVVCQRTANGVSCQATVKRVDIPAHDAECLCRTVQCDKGCKCQIILADLNEHDCTRALLKRIALLQEDSNAWKRIKTANSQLYIARWDHCIATQENYSFGIAVSSAHILLLDGNGSRILAFDLNGNFNRVWDVTGTQTSIAVFNEEVYVTGFANNQGKRQVLVYNQEGVLIRSWTRKGRRAGQSSRSSLAISNQGEVYVADYWSKNVQVFDHQGSFVRKWNHRGEDQISAVEGIAVSTSDAGDDEVYLAQQDHISVFTGNGSYLRTLTLHVEKWNDEDDEENDDEDVDTPYNKLIYAVAISDWGEIYVTDPFTNIVQVLHKTDGLFIRQFDSFNVPSGVAFSADNAFVVDKTGILMLTDPKEEHHNDYKAIYNRVAELMARFKPDVPFDFSLSNGSKLGSTSMLKCLGVVCIDCDCLDQYS